MVLQHIVRRNKTLRPLVEESENLSSHMLPPGLLVVHNTGRSGEDDETELTRREELDNPLLEIAKLDVVAGADYTGLVDLHYS
jgi:hypothetical protein